MGDLAADGELGFELEPGWLIAGAGDFDGDGRSEIAIGDSSSHFEIWGMRGDFVRLARFSLPAYSWKIAGIGDVDGDGDDDIVIQDARRRRIETALMSIDFAFQRVLLDKHRTAMWVVIDSADYDGDGQSDLLSRDLSESGRGGADVWHLSSSLYLSGSPLVLNLGIDLRVVGSADYDADGSADLLVFDPSTRQLALWLMDRDGVHSFESLGVLATGWLPAGFAVKDDVAVQ
jgi:hypothetical protein